MIITLLLLICSGFVLGYLTGKSRTIIYFDLYHPNHGQRNGLQSGIGLDCHFVEK